MFEVFPVEKCPMCKEDWEMASRRLNCNSTHGYHCVPNRQFTSLIEFCYPKGDRFPFEKGIVIPFDIITLFYLISVYISSINLTLQCVITKTKKRYNVYLDKIYSKVQKNPDFNLSRSFL